MEKGTEPKDYGPAINAIRAKCLDCCCGDKKEVKLCESYNCPLWIYRMGRGRIEKKEGN